MKRFEIIIYVIVVRRQYITISTFVRDSSTHTCMI